MHDISYYPDVKITCQNEKKNKANTPASPSLLDELVTGYKESMKRLTQIKIKVYSAGKHKECTNLLLLNIPKRSIKQSIWIIKMWM